jgi:WD40 repeat protein
MSTNTRTLSILIATAAVGCFLWSWVPSSSMASDATVRAPVAVTPQSELPQVVLKKTYQTVPAKPTVIGESPTSPSIPLAVAWSPDGKKLAALSDYGANLEVWDADGDGHHTFPINSRFTNNALAFLNDEEVLTPSSVKPTPDGRIWALSIWNPQNGSFVKGIASQYPDRSDWGYDKFTVSPDGSMVAALAVGASGNFKLGTTEFGGNPVPIYLGKTWQIVHLIPVAAPSSAAFSPDGKEIAFGGYRGVIHLYNLDDELLIKTINVFDGKAATIDSLTYSPDGKYIVANGYFFAGYDDVKSLRVIRISDGEVIASYPGHASAWKVVWSPSGKYIAFAPHDKTIRLWNPNHPDNPGVIIRDVDSMCLAFSPDGNQLASCARDGIKVFDIKQ